MEQRKSHTNFVILTQARTGSTMLQTMLNSHPEIECFGEVFNPAVSNGYEKWKDRFFLRRLANKYIRDYAVEKYLTSLASPGSEKPLSAIGFKVIYPGQFDRWSGLRYFWRTRDFKVVSLIRKNILRKYLSSRIANIEGKWSAKEARSKNKNISVVVDTRDMMRYIDRVSRIYESIGQLTQEFRGIKITYEDLSSNKEVVITQVLDYLGNIELHENALRATTVKQNPERMDQIIENYEEVCSVLRGTKYESCLEDDAKGN